MSPLAAPPLELANAISAANAVYGVPTDILTGVWIIESGATFPNLAVNSAGYGGLFGTTLWNGSTQAQANYAAGILAHLHAVYGSWTLALYHYSGGGYSAVPGQITDDSGGSDLTPQESTTLQEVYNILRIGTTSDGTSTFLRDTLLNGLADLKKEIAAIPASPTLDASVLQDITATLGRIEAALKSA